MAKTTSLRNILLASLVAASLFILVVNGRPQDPPPPSTDATSPSSEDLNAGDSSSSTAPSGGDSSTDSSSGDNSTPAPSSNDQGNQPPPPSQGDGGPPQGPSQGPPPPQGDGGPPPPPPQGPPPLAFPGAGGASSAAAAAAAAGGGFGSGGFNPFAWLFPFWALAAQRAPEIHKGGGIYINSCTACANYADASSDDAATLTDQKVCVQFIEQEVERPLKPAQLAKKVAQLKKQKPNDPTYAVLQCCHKVFANKLFGEKEAKTLNFPELEGLDKGKTCKDMVHGFLLLIKGDYPKTAAEAKNFKKQKA